MTYNPNEDRVLVYSTKETAEEKGEVCAECGHCIQYFTGDDYPQFGCSTQQEFIRLDINYFPSNKEGCDQWTPMTQDKWKLV